MLIMQIEALEGGYHPVQSQSHRTECWLPGWIEVPGPLEEKAIQCLGCCELVIEGGRLLDIVPGELPDTPESEPSAEADLAALAIDHEFRITLLELGVI